MKFIASLLFISQLYSVFVEANYSRTVRQIEDVLTCTLPRHPDYGRWTVINDKKTHRAGDKIDLNSIIRFECDPDYKLISSSAYVICNDEYDARKVPECGKLCPPMYSTTTTILKCTDRINREIKCSEATDGTYMSYRCIQYYEPPIGHKKNLLCLDGVWNFQKPVCQPVCGRKYKDDSVPLIYGGNVTTEVIYPWISAVYHRQNGEYTNVCGGSLISRRIILTAAHCVTDNYGNVLDKEIILVGVGKVYRAYNDSRDPQAQYLQVDKIISHKEFKRARRNYLADIALLVTAELVVLSESVLPVCISDVNSIYLHVGDSGEIAGWGRQENGIYSDQLRYLIIPYKYETSCAQELDSDWADKYNLEDKLCAGFYKQNKSICKGDSGSGLTFKNPEDNRYYVHGIASLAPGNSGQCNTQQNSLYTKVAHYYRFVDRELAKNYVEECKLPTYPRNGRWVVQNANDKKPGDIVSFTTLLKVICDDEYKLSGNDDMLECKESADMPTCNKYCPPMNSTSTTILKCIDKTNTEIKCSEATDGTYMSYSCTKHYQPPEGYDKYVLCLEGVWNLPKPECQPVCGRKNDYDSSAVNGNTTQGVIYPWVSAIYRRTKNEYKNICGGSLISRRVILTVAHCVTNSYGDLQSKENFKVGVGKLYRGYNDPRDTEAQYLDVESIVPHIDYRGDIRNFLADIALIVTKKSFVFSKSVLPVCIQDVRSINLYAGDIGEFAGWGKRENGEIPDELRYLEIPYKYDKVCISELRRMWADKYYLSDKLCGGSDKRNLTVCTGESGNGLMFKNPEDNRYYVHGVASLSDTNRRSCAPQNTLYTKVASYYTFIEKELAKNHVEDCKLPIYPNNGRWFIENETNKKPGDTVPSVTMLKFVCDNGYKLSGNSSLKCQEISNMPKCLILCPPMNSTATITLTCVDKMNQDVNCMEATDGTSLTYHCVPYYEPSTGYNTNLLCSGGKWNFPKPVCQPICGRKNKRDSIELSYSGVSISRDIYVIYPWIAALYQRTSEENKSICGGSLISRRIILTAAHCVTKYNGDVVTSEAFKVGLGKIYTTYNDSRDLGAQYIDVVDIILHVDYKGDIRNYLADIALLVLKTPAMLTENVLPVCVKHANLINFHVGDSGEYAGWGKMEGGLFTDTLRYLIIPYKDESTCTQELDREWVDRYYLPDKLCGGADKRNLSVCQGGSGSGLFFRNPEDQRYYVQGVASLAPASRRYCNVTGSSLFTKVARYYEFIEKELEKYYVEDEV